jgi:hypothetical protein
MRKKSNIVVQKYIDDLAETQKNIDLNDLDEESEEAREEVDGNAYNNTADKNGVHDDGEDEENEQIKMYEEDDNNSLHGNEEDEDEDEDGDEIYCVSIF